MSLILAQPICSWGLIMKYFLPPISSFLLVIQEGCCQLQVKISIRTSSANSLETDLGCTSRINFDNVTLKLHNVTLMSQKPCQHNNKCDFRKKVINKVYGFSRYSDALLKNHNFIYSVEKAFQVIKIIDLNGIGPTFYSIIFPYASSS